MGLRSLFQRKTVTTEHASPVQAVNAGQYEPKSPECQQELQDAWAELTKAARGSKVTSFHACTRTGRPWTEDPAAIRDVAATLREFPISDRR